VKLPRHISLTIEHNPHAVYYQSVPQYIDDTDIDFISDAEREKAVATNDMWEMRWYPDTPVGFCTLAASTLDALLERAREEPPPPPPPLVQSPAAFRAVLGDDWRVRASIVSPGVVRVYRTDSDAGAVVMSREAYEQLATGDAETEPGT
jgi:hypothetical protein